MNALSNHFKEPMGLLLAVLVVLSLLGAGLYAAGAPGEDYYVAWAAADSVKRDSPHYIYDPASVYKLAVTYRNRADELAEAPRQKTMAQRRRELPMTATPFMYWVTGALATGDYETDLDTWHAISLVLLAASVLATCRLLGYSIAASLAFLLPVVTWFTPLHSDLRVANVNSFQLGLIGLILWLQSRGSAARHLFAAGLATGLLVMFKPNLAAVAVLFAGGWVVRRQFSRAAVALSGMVAGAGSAVLVSSWWLGSAAAWLDWLNAIARIVDSAPGDARGNYAIMTLVTGGLGPAGQLVLALALCLLCLAFFWWGRAAVPAEEPGESRELIENAWLIAMGCIVMMLSSALVWSHYYLLTVPLLVAALRPWAPPGRPKAVPVLMLRWLPLVALVFLLDSPLQRLLETDSADYRKLASMASALILFLVGLWQFGYGIADRRYLKVGP